MIVNRVDKFTRSPQHLSEILTRLPLGADGVGAGVGAEAAYRYQAKVGAPKSVRATPRKSRRNPIDRSSGVF